MTELSAEALAMACARLADERKAEDIVALQVGVKTPITDYFVIATARNARQVRAITRALKDTAKGVGHPTPAVEGEAECGWTLIDLGDVVVHLFLSDKRVLYDLELVWGDVPRTEWSDDAT